MRPMLAISVLAFCVTQSVLAAPTSSNLGDGFSLVDTAEAYEESFIKLGVPSNTILEDVKPTPLQKESEGEPDSPQSEGGFIVFMAPPPIFEPAEPRPESIFVTPDGEVFDALTKPPPISFTRPEHLSAFDVGIQPQDSPYPPDFAELEYDPSFYPCPRWQTLFKLSAAMTVLLFASIACIMLIERMLTSLWRRMTGHRGRQPRGILEADSLLDEKRRRSRSDSIRASMWSRSQSPPKISLA